MTKKPNLTIDDIARDLGVSKTTVSRAISGKGRISAATRSRVMEYAGKCNYRPSAAAKGLAERRTRNLMLVIAGNSTHKIIRSVWEEATQREYNVLLCYATARGKAALTRALDNHKVEGVILAVEDAALTELLKQRQIPFAAPDGCRELLRKLDPGSGQIG
ncbi:MAG: LacI family DNA-binding transcriptional regulator [Oscillospiraceae bacterium]|nr:LacI family DNA-binding transcriptional regulator [Oscillospiraceae bacterium]